MKWYIEGEVQFTRSQDRDRITRRLNDRATAGGFTPEVRPDLAAEDPTWPAGWALLPTNALRIRFSYMTRDQAVADEVFADVQTWAVRNDVNSTWGYTAVAD